MRKPAEAGHNRRTARQASRRSVVSRGYGENMDATMCMCSVQGNCGRGSHPEVPARVEREGDEVARAVVHWHLGLVVKVLAFKGRKGG